MTSDQNYDISFFKPTTKVATINRNLVVKLVTIWVIAIFGFHILLRIIEKPTPEPALQSFEEVWEPVKSGSADNVQLQQFSQSLLSVLGKVTLAKKDRDVLENGFSYAINKLIQGDSRDDLINKIDVFEKQKAQITTLKDKNYIGKKAELSGHFASLLGLPDFDLKVKLAPLVVHISQMRDFKQENKDAIHAVMKKYLIHNRSFLTDMIFLGFPFHYFYTAVFLLILFIGLCWLYCKRIDTINKELGIED